MRIQVLALTALLLSACGALGGAATPTPGFVIVDATPPPVAPATPAPTSRPASATITALATVAAATRAASAATSAPTTAAATAPAATAPGASPAATSATRQTITVAFDAFPSYYPLLIMEQRGLLKARGYDLKLVPFGLDGADVPEDERFANLRSGSYDVLATTLDGFARRADPQIGAITALVDESAGADRIVVKPPIATINDLRGKRVAFSQGSVGEYFLYYAIGLAGLTPNDLTLLPQESVEAAVSQFTGGQADAVSAWVPNVLEAEQNGGKLLVASDKLRAVVDVLVSSRPALTNKAEALTAFHAAWFEALKLMTDNPSEAEQAVIDWGHPDWTAIAKPGDLADSLGPIAQATLGANQLTFRAPDQIISRLREAQAVWRGAGQAPPDADLAQAVAGTFVQAAGSAGGLNSAQPPANSSFLFTARVELPQLSAQELQSAEAVVKLPLEKVDFQPESVRLTQQAIGDLTTQVLPALRTSRLYLRIEGSAAWPGPTGRFSEQDITDFARQRAESVATYLAQQGIDPNRLIVGTLAPKFPNSLDETELTQDRIVRFTLVASGGR